MARFQGRRLPDDRSRDAVYVPPGAPRHRRPRAPVPWRAAELGGVLNGRVRGGSNTWLREVRTNASIIFQKIEIDTTGADAPSTHGVGSKIFDGTRVVDEVGSPWYRLH